MADQSSPKDMFEQIQSDLYGVALTQEQLQDVYSAGTSDGLIMHEQGNALNLLTEDGIAINRTQELQD